MGNSYIDAKTVKLCGASKLYTVKINLSFTYPILDTYYSFCLRLLRVDVAGILY
jgi:hypothetical protein